VRISRHGRAGNALRHAKWGLLGSLLCAWHGAAPAQPLFGQHYPHGYDAVGYLYGPNGTWREQTNVHFGWNFYKHCETPAHRYNPPALMREAAVTNTTAPDVNCVILGDDNSDGDITDDAASGFAFHEHAGRGLLGQQTAAPFYQFWFDDNWVARYVAQAYDRPHPSGLHDFGHRVRWRVLAGDNGKWTPYPPIALRADQVALNGILKLNAGDLRAALAHWRRLEQSSGAAYDAAQRRFNYSFAAEDTYYYGLWLILSERLLALRTPFAERREILQHAMSLRSWLLTLQERDRDGRRLGWRTSTAPHALINTETTSISVLALGASASWVLEPGYEPLLSSPGSYVNENNALAAVAGQSVPGQMVYGPYLTLEPGRWDVEFTLRTKAARIETPLALLEIYDGTRTVAAMTIDGENAPIGDEWRRYRLTADIAGALNSTEFRVFWHGANDLDVGPIRAFRSPAIAAARISTDAARRVKRGSPAPAPSISCRVGTSRCAIAPLPISRRVQNR